ncbi:MAG: glutaminyl-peptide cyclotransferase [Acidobacteria bacterium]|nr:glutaminyl-peptide cyclotransferase [Acidobacteriota bacterium]
MSSLFKSAFIAALMLSTGCDISQANGSGIQQQGSAPFRVQNFGYEVVNSYPHDPDAFTQGLVYYQGVLYESTGLNTKSSLREVELITGRVIKKIDVPDIYFAEGLALFNNRFYQLTWQNQKAFVYDFASLALLPTTFSYSGEGWGLTNNSQSLIMSNGSNQIRFLDPETFQTQRTINVTDNDRSVSQLNELEFIKGEIFANIWYDDRVARIDPNSGRVTGWINLAGLMPQEDRARIPQGAVLNGIAYDEANDRLFITGKLWSKIFQIKLVSRRDPISR